MQLDDVNIFSQLMNKYIDIHAHQTPNNDKILAVKNYILGLNSVENHDIFSIGIHPWYIDEGKSNIKDIENLINKDNCIAIGECGLDLMPKILKQYDIAKQEEIFLLQAELSEQYQKPLIIHCVKCFDRLLSIKKTFKPQSAWIIHGYSKNANLAGQLIEAEFYISFGAHLFNSAKNREALKSIPINRLFLETDDQAFYDIKSIYEKTASIKGISVNRLQQVINLNFKKVFGRD